MARTKNMARARSRTRATPRKAARNKAPSAKTAKNTRIVGDGGAGSAAPRPPEADVVAPLPTLGECERAIGEKAAAWVARCYEISCAIVKTGLVDGDAVYGHWVGPVAPKSHFADRSGLPFVPHGWILLKDGRVFDPTRWVFEAVTPYLFIGEPPDSWGVVPCDNCDLLREEHKDGGPEDQCEAYEPKQWPYDEGGNRWREAITRSRPKPVPKGPRSSVDIKGLTKLWVGALLDERDGARLTANQLMHLANMSYDVLKQGVGPDGVKMIYAAIVDFGKIAWIPLDNFNRARRECGLTREY